PGRRDVRAAGGPAAVSGEESAADVATAAICQARTRSPVCTRYARTTRRRNPAIVGQGPRRTLSKYASARQAFAGDVYGAVASDVARRNAAVGRSGGGRSSGLATRPIDFYFSDARRPRRC